MNDNSKIKLIKFTSGEEVIAEVTNVTSDTLTFKKALRIMIIPDQSGVFKLSLAAYVPYVKVDEFTVDRINVLWDVEPADKMLEQYNQVYGKTPMLTVPKTKLILPG